MTFTDKQGSMVNYLRQMNLQAVLLRVLCWFLFVGYELTFLYLTKQKFSPAIHYIAYYAGNILLFYTHLAVLDFTFKRIKPAYLIGLLLFTLQFLLILLAKAIVDYALAISAYSFSDKMAIVKAYLPSNTFRNCYFIIFATFYWVGGNIVGYRRKAELARQTELIALKEKAELEMRLAKSRNAYLQQQINPHMLFNALTFIHNRVYESSPEAAACILLLSDMMRYGLDAAGPDGKTRLADEVEQLEHLLDINRFRFEGALFIRQEIRGPVENFRIIPLILLTLTENLFKHGDLTNPEHPAELKLIIDDQGQLRFYTRNLKKVRASLPRIRRMGLENTRLRLNFSYLGNYTLESSSTGDYFELELKLNLS